MIHDRIYYNAVPLVITLLSLESNSLAFFQILVSGSMEVSVWCSCPLLNGTHKPMILVLSGWHLMLEKLLKTTREDRARILMHLCLNKR